MSDAPVQDLIDQLNLMRVELGDVKKRQLTEERLKHLQAALEDNAAQIAGVQNAAAHGGKEGAERLTYSLDRTASKMEQTVDDAVRGLSEARRDASDTILARRRNVGLFVLFSALTGLATALCFRWLCLIITWNVTSRIVSDLWGGIVMHSTG